MHLPEKTLVVDDLEKHNLSRDDLNNPGNELSSSSNSKSSSQETDSDFTNSQNNTSDKKFITTRHRFQSVIEDFIHLYSNSPIVENDNKCIIMQGNFYKIIWDVWILSLLLVVSIIVPVRLAFTDNESLSWLIYYTATDAFFFIDIILTFFTSITDGQKVYEIVDKRVIARSYLTGWFWVDVISILPLDLILMSNDQ